MKYVIANWKMNMDMALVCNWFEGYKKTREVSENFYEQVTPIVAPSFIHIPYAFLESENLPEFEIASQDISHYGKGSHTGENGAFQVKDFCKYCIVGHSERSELIDVVLQKRDLALEAGLIPIVCFVSPADALKYYSEGVILAWEDPANISEGGQYKEKPIEEIQETVVELRNSLPKNAILLYGGSVNKTNVADLAKLEVLDGVLVGQASLDPVHFFELVKAYEISRSEE
jgi:triosephosphate isomerase